jgi:mRNA interferase RelE/StbE
VKVVYEPAARRQLEALDPPVRARVEADIAQLSVSGGFPLGARRLVGGDGWRIRVGDWRVIYSVEGDDVRVKRVGHRREVYRRR